MNGGIDLAYSHFFGWDLWLRQRLRREYAGELPVGSAVIISTHHRTIPYLVSAPTMRAPDNIADTVNVYLAFRAALLAAKASKEIKSLLSPALGTGVGSMPIERAARQMYAAYAEVVLGETQWLGFGERPAKGLRESLRASHRASSRSPAEVQC